jgi:hypothetical protein
VESKNPGGDTYKYFCEFRTKPTKKSHVVLKPSPISSLKLSLVSMLEILV